MPQINPHINFNGNAEEAFRFYQSVFGGDFSALIRFKEIASEAYPVPEKEAEKIMHIALPIGSVSLMGNDVPESMGRTNEHENRSKIYLSAETKEELFQIYRGLSTGAEVEIPLEVDADGPYYAMLRDKYGIEWILNYEPPL